MKRIDLDAKRPFGLDNNLVTEEKIPLVVESPQNIKLKRILE